MKITIYEPRERTVNTKFDIGQRVQYRGWDGRTSITKIEDIGDKDGRVVYDLANGHWGYEDQLEAR